MEETSCPESTDQSHCECWWDMTGPCCYCKEGVVCGRSCHDPNCWDDSNHECHDGDCLGR